MFASTIVLSLLSLLPMLPLTLAAPVVHLAPLRRAVEVGGQHANGRYIVSIKPDTVNPDARGQWLNKVLGAHNVTLDYETTQNLKLRWNKDVFNGISGPFSSEAINVLRKQPEVAYIAEGPSFSLSVDYA
jgi:cerevisin